MGKNKNDTITTEKCIEEILENALNRITDDIDNAFYSRDNNIIIAKIINILSTFNMSIYGFNDMVDLAKKSNLDIPDEIKAAAKNEKILDKIDYDKVKTIYDDIDLTEYETLNDKPYLADRLYLADKLYLVNDYIYNTDTDYNTIRLDEIIIPLLESSFKNLSIVDLYTMSAEDIKSRIYDNITSDIKNDIQKVLINAYDEIYNKHNHKVKIFLGNISEEYIDNLHYEIYQLLHDERIIPLSKDELDMLPDVKSLPIIYDILKCDADLSENDPQIRKNNLYHLMEKYYKDTLEMYLYAIMLDIETNSIIDTFQYRKIKNTNSDIEKKLPELLKSILSDRESNGVSLDTLIDENDSESISIISEIQKVADSIGSSYPFKGYESDDLILYSFLPAIITIYVPKYITCEKNLKCESMPNLKRSSTYNLYEYNENNAISSDILTYIGLDECDIEKINHNLLPNREATNAYEKRVLENLPNSKINVDIDDGYYTNAYITDNLIEIYKNIYESQKKLISMHKIYPISDLFCSVLHKQRNELDSKYDLLESFYKLMATVILRHFSNFAFKEESPWNLTKEERDYIEKDFMAKGKKSVQKFRHENLYELFILDLANYYTDRDIEIAVREDFYIDITGNLLSDSISTEIFNDSYKISDRYYILDSYKNYAYINPIDYEHFSDPEGKYHKYKQKFLDDFVKFLQNKENIRFDEEHDEKVNLNQAEHIFTKDHNKLIRSVLLSLSELNEYERDCNVWLHPDDRDDDF